jgi:hypothetical protein
VDGQTYETFFRSSQGPWATTADPFVPVALFPAMKLGAELWIEGRVSARLLARLDQIQDVIAAWWPAYSKVAVQAAHILPASSPPLLTHTAAFFSGGIDSTYTALKHQETLTHLIFVRGFDMRQPNAALWDVIAPPIRDAVRSLNKHLIEVETNARTLLDLYADWDWHCNGAALAAVALALAPAVQIVYIAGAYPYDVWYPEGNHPLLNALWSNGDVEILYDADLANRWDKLGSLVESEVALQWLRVCYKNSGLAYNCGRCRKCLAVKCYLKAAGVLQNCPTLDEDIDLERVAQMPIDSLAILTMRTSLLDAVERFGTQPQIADAIRTSIMSSSMAHEFGRENSQVASLAQRLATLEHEIHTSEARVEKLAARLHTMQTSRSWRLPALARRFTPARRGQP